MGNFAGLSEDIPNEPKGQGILRIASNEELRDQAEEEHQEQSLNEMEVVNSLSAHVNRKWEAARTAKIEIEERMLMCLRQRNGHYEPTKLAEIRDMGGSEVYMMLTSIKCRALISWVNDIIFQPGDKPWTIEPTPIPELRGDIEDSIREEVRRQAIEAMTALGIPVSPDMEVEKVEEMKEVFNKKLTEEAHKRASAMEVKIEDQLLEADWERAIKDMINDLATYPSAILKGPVIRKRKKSKWAQIAGKWGMQVRSTLTPVFYRVAPFDYYPSPDSTGVDDGYSFERHRLRRKDLVAMKGVEGYNEIAIDAALTQYGIGGLRTWLSNDQERADLEGRPNEWLSNDGTLDALEFHGSIQGKLLLQWGMTSDQIKNELDEYEVEVWKIGVHIIRAVINDDPLERRPYYMAAFEDTPGSIWGISLPEIMRDLQDICNAAARSLVNNMSISSGPMVEVQTDRLAPGEDIESMHPWMILQTQSDPNGGGRNNPAVRFHNPSSNAGVLQQVYEYFSRKADEYTGIPAYTYGDSNVGGAGKTASGLSMLMSAASRGIKQVISHIDVPVSKSIGRMYELNMLYDDDESIKGDAVVVAKGSKSLIAKEQQQIRRTEFLDRTNNDIDFGIMGPEGRAELLREVIKSMDIDPSDIIPDKDDLIQKAKMAMMSEAGGEGKNGQQLNPAGQPVAGQDAALFQQQ